MKNIIILFLVIFQMANAAEKDSLISVNPFSKYHLFLEEEDDCDACGCSASGGSMGFASMLNSNFVGVRYFNQQYKSSDGLYSNSPWYKENFNTVQVWARVPVSENIQISALIPYHFHDKETSSGNKNIDGVGDVTVLAMYRLYQTHKDSTFFVHTLQMGGGIKMPTGKFNEVNSGSLNPSFQVGTGSWDYLLATEYILRRKQFGLNAMFNYVLKTENQKNYRFGNQFNYAGTFFYLYEKNDFSIVPQLGLAGEVYESNYQHSQKLKDTSGEILFGKLGFEVGKDRFSIGANAMLPIYQNLTGGNVEANYRWSINFNYSL
ncbi:transporter [Flavobacterium lacustre]|uniref:transporter n=1 Tax=Flavobacterium lacustre TaxID=3016339 RepID=UPI0022B71F97|nr:transporter [Flavobacterium lacustre]